MWLLEASSLDSLTLCSHSHGKEVRHQDQEVRVHNKRRIR